VFVHVFIRLVRNLIFYYVLFIFRSFTNKLSSYLLLVNNKEFQTYHIMNLLLSIMVLNDHLEQKVEFMSKVRTH